MFKFFSVLLLLVVCFLIGTIVGIDRSEQTGPPAEIAEETVDVSSGISQTAQTENQDTEIVDSETVAQELSQMNQDHLSQKTASFIEVIVKGFYDIVVEIMYQISQLFI